MAVEFIERDLAWQVEEKNLVVSSHVSIESQCLRKTVLGLKWPTYYLASKPIASEFLLLPSGQEVHAVDVRYGPSGRDWENRLFCLMNKDLDGIQSKATIRLGEYLGSRGQLRWVYPGSLPRREVLVQRWPGVSIH